MTKWTYLKVFLSDMYEENDSDMTLDKLGEEGWELVSVDKNVFYFKKELEHDFDHGMKKKLIRRRKKNNK